VKSRLNQKSSKKRRKGFSKRYLDLVKPRKKISKNAYKLRLRRREKTEL
jgi:hypothetical protein